MSTSNPLTKYYRQPKIYISLPSKGLNYPPGVLNGDYNNVPIFGMTGMDEIMMKTPDALFNGESSVKVIESCCPYITNARLMPSIDVDAVLIAIRIATYGNNMTVNAQCSKCNETNDYEFRLQGLLDYFSSQTFEGTVKISEEITVKIRPLNYEEMTAFSIENFKLQRMLYQVSQLAVEEQNKHVNELYAQLGMIQVNVFMSSIESVTTPDGVVTEKEHIKSWLQNTDKDVYQKIKSHLEENKKIWEIPKQPVKCVHCEHEDTLALTLDQSSFFG